MKCSCILCSRQLNSVQCGAIAIGATRRSRHWYLMPLCCGLCCGWCGVLPLHKPVRVRLLPLPSGSTAPAAAACSLLHHALCRATMVRSCSSKALLTLAAASASLHPSTLGCCTRPLYTVAGTSVSCCCLCRIMYTVAGYSSHRVGG